jgi:hypothetical protein
MLMQLLRARTDAPSPIHKLLCVLLFACINTIPLSQHLLLLLLLLLMLVAD